MMSKLLFDVIAGVPLTLGRQIVEKLIDEVDRERLITEESIRERLQQLQLLLQDGEMTEEEYEGLEAKLIERLRAVRKYKQEMDGE